MGSLWNSLAEFYIRSGLFERARDIYEEAISTVTTVRDFTQVFDAYAQFQELILSTEMDKLQVTDCPRSVFGRGLLYLNLTIHLVSRLCRNRRKKTRSLSSYIWPGSRI